MVKPTAKQQEYDAAMERQSAPRSAVTGGADPFGDYSLTDWAHELAILEALGRSWKMSFCPVTQTNVRRAGGLWLAYDAAFNPRSILHVEQFEGKFEGLPDVNFWAETIISGRSVAAGYGLPFTVVTQFDDGRYVLKFSNTIAPEQTIKVGERVNKGVSYAGVLNLVTYFSTKDFTRISQPRESVAE